MNLEGWVIPPYSPCRPGVTDLADLAVHFRVIGQGLNTMGAAHRDIEGAAIPSAQLHFLPRRESGRMRPPARGQVVDGAGSTPNQLRLRASGRPDAHPGQTSSLANA